MSDLQDYQEGPLSMLKDCVENGTKIIIDIKGEGNKKLIAKVVSFDHRFNMILKDIVEEWVEKRGRVRIHKKRNIEKIFLPGNSVKIIVKVTE